MILPCLRFSPQEDEFLKVMFITGKEKRVSRLAIKLHKSYDSVQSHLRTLGLLDEKIKKTKFKTNDELEYDLLMSGNAEAELKEILGSCVVHIKKQSGGNDE